LIVAILASHDAQFIPQLAMIFSISFSFKVSL
jgi:hypothetical protein